MKKKHVHILELICMILMPCILGWQTMAYGTINKVFVGKVSWNTDPLFLYFLTLVVLLGQG